jgi:cytochrome c oxidase subunit II
MELVACNAKPVSIRYTFVIVTMRRYAIEPAEIRVKQGDRAELEVSTKDVQHGFSVPELGINEPIVPGRPAKIRLDTSKKGEFKVACSILCGPRHDDMHARIVIE